MADILIERFEVDVPNSAETFTYNLTNDVGDLSKAFLKIHSNSLKVFGNPSGGVFVDQSSNGQRGQVMVELTDTDELTFTICWPQRANDGSFTRKVCGEVWRYVGPSGGRYEFITRQRGTLSDATGSNTSITDSISGINDRNDCVPFCNGWRHDGHAVDFLTAVYMSSNNRTFFINSSDEIEATKESGVYDRPSEYAYEVVEFTGAGWEVYHLRTPADALNYSLNGGALFANHTITRDSEGLDADGDLGDWQKAFVIETSMGADGGNWGLDDSNVLFKPTGSDDNRSSQDGSILMHAFHTNDAGQGSQHYAMAHILKCVDHDIVVDGTWRYVAQGNGASGDWQYIFFDNNEPASTRDLEKTSMEYQFVTNGTGNAFLRGRWTTKLLDYRDVDPAFDLIGIGYFTHFRGNGIQSSRLLVDLSLLVSTTELDVDAASISLSPQSINLLYNRFLEVGAAIVSLGAQDVNLIYNRVLEVVAANLSITRQDVNLYFNRLLTLDPANITLTPQDVEFIRGFFESIELDSLLTNSLSLPSIMIDTKEIDSKIALTKELISKISAIEIDSQLTQSIELTSKIDE